MSDAQGITIQVVIEPPSLTTRRNAAPITLQIAGFDLIMEGSLLRDGKR